MQAMPLPEIPRGARLAAPLFDARQRLLAPAGAELTTALQEEAGRYYASAPIVDGGADAPGGWEPGRQAALLHALHEAQRYLGGQLARRQPRASAAGTRAERELQRAIRAALEGDPPDDPFGAVRTAPVLRWLDEAVASCGVAVRVGRALGAPEAEVEALAHGMLLRDVALTTSHSIRRQRPLTPLVRRATQAHAEAAANLLHIVEWGAPTVRLVVAQHHERRDGSGYPRGLRGADLHERGPGERFNRDLMIGPAEIAAACDVFVALQQPRPHRPPHTPEAIRTLLTAGAGGAFHADVVAVLLETYFGDVPIGHTA